MADVESKKCLLCGSVNLQRLFPVEKFNLLQCRVCELQFLDPLPDKKSLDLLYENYYSNWGIDRLAEEVSFMKKRTFRNYLGRLPLQTVRGAFLDVGCATGEMLALAREMGYDVYGVEVSPQGIQLCRQLYGENKIMGKSLDHGDFPADFFDVITLSDVLEHMPDPPGFIDMIEKMLKPLGLLMIVTPDTLSWTNRIMGRYWPHYKVEHLCYFNRYNLSKMCLSRFRPLVVDRAYKTLTLNYISSIIHGYHRNRAVRAVVRLIQCLPKSWRSHPFNLNIGEMFMLLERRP